jgi:hypothetical protein
MNGKTSGVHKRGLKQRQTATFLKGILYIKKQQVCLFEHTKNNFSTAQVLQQKQKCIKNAQQSDTCVCYLIGINMQSKHNYICNKQCNLQLHVSALSG